MTATKPEPALLKTKPHFEILDGLRGIAAVSVVIFHFMEIAVPDPSKNFIEHSYLAVDFFFCLSGFVIAYAYDSKLENIGAIQFFKLRLVRLHPLVVIGSVLGLLTFLFDPFSNLHQAYSTGKTFLMFLASILLIPYASVHERYFNFFHFNPPTWSLFWEYIANIFYALVLFKLRNKTMWALVLIAAIALCFEAHYADNLSVGWGGGNFTGGGARVFYSFLAGMLVYRIKWIIKSRFGFISMGILLAIVFLVPFNNKFNYIADPAIIIFYFPFLIALGAGASINSAHNKFCKFLGEISYPLYMVHYPFIWVFFSYIEAKKPAMNQLETVIPIATVLLIGLAHYVLVFFDLPLRKYFTAKMKKNL